MIQKTRTICLANGEETIVDAEDYEYLSQWKWHKSTVGYAARSKKRRYKSNPGKEYMHRVVNKTPKGMQTDHINRNKLDNRKCNLRSCTRSENIFNNGIRCDNKSGYKGICWDKRRKKWDISIGSSRKKGIGLFDSLEDAIKARQEEVVMRGIIA